MQEAEVIFDFDPLEDDELRLQKGELDKNDLNWWEDSVLELNVPLNPSCSTAFSCNLVPESVPEMSVLVP